MRPKGSHTWLSGRRRARPRRHPHDGRGHQHHGRRRVGGRLRRGGDPPRLGRGPPAVAATAGPPHRDHAVRAGGGVRRSRPRRVRRRLGLQPVADPGSSRRAHARLDHAGVPLRPSALTARPGHRGRRRGRRHRALAAGRPDVAGHPVVRTARAVRRELPRERARPHRRCGSRDAIPHPVPGGEHAPSRGRGLVAARPVAPGQPADATDWAPVLVVSILRTLGIAGFLATRHSALSGSALLVLFWLVPLSMAVGLVLGRLYAAAALQRLVVGLESRPDVDQLRARPGRCARGPDPHGLLLVARPRPRADADRS